MRLKDSDLTGLASELHVSCFPIGTEVTDAATLRFLYGVWGPELRSS